MTETAENTTTHWWNNWWFKLTRLWLRRMGFFLVPYVLITGPLCWQWYEAQYLEGPIFYVLFFLPITMACQIEFVGNFIDWYALLWI